MSPTTREVEPRVIGSSGAILGDTYRYHLWRVWDAQAPRVVWVMLNPSTANATATDPTLTRCIAHAKAWGFGGLEVVNLFALRSPHPKRLLEHPDPVGPANDAWIAAVAAHAHTVVVAWGAVPKVHRERAKGVAIRLRWRGDPPLYGAPLYTLGLTADGSPKHPLARGRSHVPVGVKLQLFGGGG